MPQIEGLLQGTFTGCNGLDLYYQGWLPPQPAKAILGIVHGLGSHSGWFATVATALAASGYAVYGLDLRGHGRSPGQRSYINRWSEFRSDFECFRQLMITQHPDLPCFALGHSLGAIIILDYALHHPQDLAGLMMMAPALKPTGVPPIRLAIGQLLSWTFPRFTLDTGIPKNVGSRDPEILAAYLQDPLRHRKGTARLATEFLATVRQIQANLHQLQTPVITLHGNHDFVTPSASSRILFEQIAILDKEYREYPGAYHDLHNDSDTPQVITDMINWLDRHVAGELNRCQLSHPK